MQTTTSPRQLSSSDLRERILWFAIPLVAFAWFWIWRSNQLTGGDSDQWTRDIDNGIWLRKRQMLSFAIMELIYQLTHALWGWTSRLAINFTSCASGAAALVIVWRMVRSGPSPWWSFAVAATAGFTTIFYGHIESYAQPAAAFVLHLLAIQRCSENRWRPWTIAATFSLFMASHLVAIFLLPVAIALALIENHRQGSSWEGLKSIALAFLPALLVWVAVRYTKAGTGQLSNIYNWTHPPRDFLIRPWLVFFDPSNLRFKLAFAAWNGGLAAILAFWVFATHWRDRTTLYFFACFLAFIGFTLVWVPHAEYADFDLFCFPWIVAVIAVARHVMALPLRAAWMGLLLGTNFYLWLTRPAIFAEIDRRGYGTISVQWPEPLDQTIIRIDEEFRAKKINRFISLGGHSVSVRQGKHPAVFRAVNIRGGDHYRFRCDINGNLERID